MRPGRHRALPAIVAAAAIAAAVLPAHPSAAQDDALPARATIPTAMPTLLLPAVPSVAPGYAAPRVTPGPPAIVGVTAQPFVGISLQDAIAMALLRNPNLAVSASNIRVARYNVTQAKGAFDVALHLQPSSSYSVSPPVNFLEAGPGEVGEYGPSPAPIFTTGPGNIIQHQSGFQYGVQGQTVNGTLYNASIQQQRTYNNTTFNAYNPYYLASLNLSVTQPLLKNAGMNSAKRQLKLAFINSDSATAQTLVDASTTISAVENVYWDLVAAWRNVAIQEVALKEAIAQQQSNVRLAQRGAGAAIDAIESQTQVSSFQDAVYSSLENVSRLQNRLKSLVASNGHDPVWDANLVPSTSVQQLPSASDLSGVIAQAQRNRPEIRQAEDKRLAAGVDVVFAQNQSLPQADVQAEYESNGFAGLLTPVPTFILGYCTGSKANGGLGLQTCPTPPPNTQGAMPWAYHNMWAGYFPTFNIALIVGYPIQGHVARGLRGVASEEVTQAKLAMASVQQRIGAEARNALQSYQSALSRLNATARARESAEAVYASEVRKFRNGESTTYLVLQRQTELAQARGAELQAQTQLNESVVELQRVEGTILTTNGVDVQKLGTRALAQ